MRYSTFISYNHHDRAAAGWLHRAIETYRIPKRLRGRPTPFGPLGARPPPVFRDREELAAGSDLAKSVQDALAQAQSLVVVCSPNGAASLWVNEEIRAFTALGRRAYVQCLIIGGTPNASRMPAGDPAQECLPPALFENGGREPLAADIRSGGDGRRNALLKLLAGILEIPYDELRQREQARRQQRLAVAAGALGAGFVAMSALALTAALERDEALRQRDIARQKTLTAERTVSFVKSLFEVADPSEARGQTITAREILDKGARQLDHDLSEEPSVKAELSTTLGEVYGGLGLYQTNEALVRKALALPRVDPSTRVREYLALGDALVRKGEDVEAMGAYRQAMALAGDPRAARQDLIPRILLGLGEAQSQSDDAKDADRNIRVALSLDAEAQGPDTPQVAHDLEALGYNQANANELAAARASMAHALAIRMKTQGPNHPKTAEDLTSLGAIAYLQRDSLTAESYYRQALAADHVVLGDDHPEVAATMNNLARSELERRDFAEAEPLLAHAISVILKQQGDSYFDLAYDYDNLGHSREGLHRIGEAKVAYEKALAVARVHKHRNLAPILTDLADIDCDAGETAAGETLLKEARPIMAAVYADAPWQSAWVGVIEGGCLLRAGRRAEARALLEHTAPVVLQAWKPDTLYGARAMELLNKARSR